MHAELWGFIFLLISGGIFAYLVKDGYKRRRMALSGLLSAAELMIMRISIFNSSIPSLLSELSEKGETTDSFFSALYEEVSNGRGIKSGFERALKEDTGLKKEDNILIEGLRESLGEREKEAQLEALKSLREAISERLCEAAEEEKRKLKYEGALTLSVFAVMGIVLL